MATTQYHSYEFCPHTVNLPDGGTRTVTKDGYIMYKNKEGETHRDPKDGPALICPDICVEYQVNNKFHRPIEDGPAVIWADGTYEFFLNGERHNPNGPAIWTTYNLKDPIAYLVRFIHNSKVINTKEDCKDYHLKPGDYFFNALHLDEDGQKVYMAIEELVVNHEGQTYDGFWRVEGPEGPEFCHILFMNRFVDEDVHNSYAIPGIVDSVNWELENLK